ncbi:MAG: hypothetical protein ACOCRO_10670 [Halanaerobiales bacterium]
MKLKSKIIICLLGILLLGNIVILVKAIKKGSFELGLKGEIDFKGQIDEG